MGRATPEDVINHALIATLRAGLAGQADAAQAAAMQAYMKSALPFHGVPAPARRALQKAAVAAHPCASVDELAATMRALWDGAPRREERYAASELAGIGAHRRLVTIDLLPIYRHMIVTGAWWDHVDEISGNGLAVLLARGPTVLAPELRRWARGDDLWLRRAAMLVQRKRRGDDFDAVLFRDCLLPSLLGASPLSDDFFIRKGMGWALRERAYAAPDEVKAFCAEHAERLSPLTLREALRVCDPAAQARRPLIALGGRSSDTPRFPRHRPSAPAARRAGRSA